LQVPDEHGIVLLCQHRPQQLTEPDEQFDEARSFMYRIQKSDDPDIAAITKDLYALHDAIKPPKPVHHPNAGNIDAVCKTMVDLLPSQSICDKLVALYFDNYENCLRILHKQSFSAEYRLFCESYRQIGYAAFSDFVPTLLIVLSVASSLNLIPECGEVSLDGHGSLPSALQLVEAWYGSLSFKQKYSISTLRLRVLTLLPQRGRTSKIEDLWNLSGQIVRHAMTVGLHRDATTNISVFEAEQRRKLWMTIVEEDLIISLMCGMPPMVSSDDFVCNLPTNVDDSELFEEMTELPISRSTSEWTDSICQHVLASTLLQRLKAYRYMSNTNADIKYEEVLKYTRGLEKILQELPAPLRFDHVPDQASGQPGRLFARMTLDILIRRVLLSLYTPFAFAIPLDDSFREMRVSYIQSCLVLLCYQDIFDPKFSELETPQAEGYWDTFYNLYKHDIVQTCLGVCIEIKRLNRASNASSTSASAKSGLTPVLDHADTVSSKVQPWTKASLIKTVEDTIEPMVRRVARPGSNAKDLVCLAVVLHSLRSSHSSDHKELLIKEGVTELIRACQRQLQRAGVVLPSPTLTTYSGALGDLPNTQLDFSGLADLAQFDLEMASFPDMSFSGNTDNNKSVSWN
jgi:Fungal specific transcription factor domain